MMEDRKVIQKKVDNLLEAMDGHLRAGVFSQKYWRGYLDALYFETKLLDFDGFKFLCEELRKFPNT